MELNRLDEQTHNALVDLLADESVTKTEAIRDILKGKRFHYNSVVRDEVEEDNTREDYHKQESFKRKPSRQTSASSGFQNKPKKQEEVTIDCTNGNYVEPKDPVEAMKPVGHVPVTPPEVIAAKHLGEQNAMTKMMIPFLPKDLSFEKSSMLLNKYTDKLKYNDDGSAQNMVSLVEAFKKEIKEKYENKN